MENMSVSITPSLMLEYLYCPRFVYYMEVLHIKQQEDKRMKVKRGREVHKRKSLENRDYKRKKIGVVEKLVEQPLYSDKWHIHGIVDEILILYDGTAAPLDYKFAEYKDKVYKTNDKMGYDVNHGYLVYTRSKSHIEEIEIGQKEKDEVLKYTDEILNIIQTGIFPKVKGVKRKCIDCCYRNLC
jgi:CRISPR-associated exonuclease Cas4